MSTLWPKRRRGANGQAQHMITAEHLTKTYGGNVAVSDISFACKAGTVTGFLGPNGAGESTTMRMLCGLAPPTSGSSTVAGRPYRELPNPGLEVGVLLDTGAQHLSRTGREVLTLSSMVLGMLLLSAPQAIVAYLLGPVILSSVASLVAALETPAQWLSLLDTTTRLLGEEMTGQAWAQIATSFAVWSLLPLLLGAVRVQRREIQ